MNKRLLLSGLLLLSSYAYAGEVRILGAALIHQSQGEYFVNVKLQHNDTGWDHYADEWRLVTHDGQILARRVLMHPHVEEQPFARGQSDVRIDDSHTTLFIEAHDTVHGWSSDRLEVNMTAMKGGKLFITTPTP